MTRSGFFDGLVAVWASSWWLAGTALFGASALPSLDLTLASAAAQWSPAHDIRQLSRTPEGLAAQISGADPYLVYLGPALNFPAGQLLWLNLRLKSEAGGLGQVFYYQSNPTEPNSVRFPVPAGEWFDARLPLPALGQGYRFRIDPPGTTGTCVVAALRFEARLQPIAPSWPMPVAPQVHSTDPSLESGGLRLIHNQTQWGGFTLQVDGQAMAVGQTQPLVGYLSSNQVRWLALSQSLAGKIQVTQGPGNLAVSAEGADAEGARWQWRQHFSSHSVPGSIEVETTVTTDRDRQVIYLPLLQLLAGLDHFGTNKTQGLLAGVEYLENEPSSSEADVMGPGSRRQVVDTAKITFPLMAIAAANRYLGLVWQPDPNLCAVFDSPDRLFRSGGHLMGLLFPGSNGVNRDEGNVLPYDSVLLAANQPFTARATILGGTAPTVVEAVQHYVTLRGLPPVPDTGYPARDYFALAARGWLDSAIRVGNRYRHASGTSFTASPAADAAYYEDWLSDRVEDPNLAARLATSAREALSAVAPENRNASQVGHVRVPLPALIYGAVAENAAQALLRGRSRLGQFQPDGTVLYVAPASGIDYARTHWARHASGLTAQAVAVLMDDAVFAGDRELLARALERLRDLSQYHHTVPRGAQTWEVPLHTPDILAAAYLVRAYTLGYELTGDPQFLSEAQYWAWTGVPFVYLHPPVAKPVGLYSTIPVLGATGFEAPVWIGLPVQWCGLVYGDALYRLARHDRQGPWQRLAEGIAASGVQQTYPPADPQFLGLLPDSYSLRTQGRNGPNINPATVLATATRLFHQPALYDFAVFRAHGIRLHAAGEITGPTERADSLQFSVTGWSRAPYFLLLNGVWKPPVVILNGKEIRLTSPHQYTPSQGRLILSVEGNPTLEIRHPALTSLQIRAVETEHLARISWSRGLTNLVLQTANQVTAPADWQGLAAPVESEGADWVVKLPLAAPQQFFRLQQTTYGP